ncbi:hypothetical protein C2E23DRAFT_742816 [Lenzites betulinus]|nr:hypothetical protein C2E23DRAFT_742816 [Lenzites betulinus]
MASAASPSTPSGGVGASMWAGQPPSRGNWGRGGEPGSAFRGMSRGRPGRGGGGRGGRGGGGRGGGRAGGPNSPRPDEQAFKVNGDQPKEQIKKAPSTLNQTSSVPSTSDTTSSLPAKPSGRSKDPKPPARKPSESKPPRKLPPIVVNPPPATSNSGPPSVTTPNRSRRKRSQTKGSTSSVSSRKSPSTESSSSLLRADKSPVISKDLPPHLAPPPPPETPSFDIKHDIDAFVERVRAVAMDRPHTPGSHIDWAGDDDDSLPDLDDWGVKSLPVTSVAATLNQPDLISPILADALKPLPNLDFGSPLTGTAVPSEIQPAPSSHEPAAASLPGTDGDNTPRGAPTPSQGKASPMDEKGSRVNGDQAEAPPSKREDVKVASNGLSVNGGQSKPKPKGAPRSPQQKSKAPLHPSLPAKPAAITDAPVKRPPPPHKPLVPVVQTEEVAPAEVLPKSGVVESVPAVQAKEATKEDSSSKDSSPERQGLTASIHAPHLSTMSAPSHITTHTSTSTPSFQPTHGRAHTIGRPNGLRMPYSASHGSFPDALERRSHRDRINHARTHSSPPTGPGTSTARARAVHASRPVITGAAISQLVRSLGGPPPQKREAAAAAAPAAAATQE